MSGLQNLQKRELLPVTFDPTLQAQVSISSNFAALGLGQEQESKQGGGEKRSGDQVEGETKAAAGGERANCEGRQRTGAAAEGVGEALGVMQSCWAIGYALAAGLTALVLPRFGWRAVFFAGILPALVTLWIRRHVEEPRVWAEAATGARRGDLRDLLVPPWRGHVLAASLVSAATMFAWWGLFTWIPAYLALPPAQGGAGLSVVKTSAWVILMQVGMWLGYLTFGMIADRLGRKPAYVGYLAIAAVLVPIYGATSDPL
ncbi:MAG: MFS transporter, partial [Acidobacteriota bacterium]